MRIEGSSPSQFAPQPQDKKMIREMLEHLQKEVAGIALDSFKDLRKVPEANLKAIEDQIQQLKKMGYPQADELHSFVDSQGKLDLMQMQLAISKDLGVNTLQLQYIFNEYQLHEEEGDKEGIFYFFEFQAKLADPSGKNTNVQTLLNDLQRDSGNSHIHDELVDAIAKAWEKSL